MTQGKLVLLIYRPGNIYFDGHGGFLRTNKSLPTQIIAFGPTPYDASLARKAILHSIRTSFHTATVTLTTIRIYIEVTFVIPELLHASLVIAPSDTQSSTSLSLVTQNETYRVIRPTYRVIQGSVDMEIATDMDSSQRAFHIMCGLTVLFECLPYSLT